MAVRSILLYPKDEVALRKKSLPVQGINHQVRCLIKDLKDTLKEHQEGIGLAAPQINIHKNIVVVRLGIEREEEWKPGPAIALVNPSIQEASDFRKDFDGCLSFPGLYGETTRPHYLRVGGLDENGEPLDRIFLGFNAVLVHHEIDHLDGVLFIDRIETIEDLYRISVDEEGQVIRIPVSFYWHSQQQKGG